MKVPRALATAMLLVGVSACGADGNATAATAPARHGHVTGKAVDARGEPIAGARVLLDNTVFHASHMETTTAADGSYRLKMHPGAWLATATFRKEYNGRTYQLELHPESPDAFDDDGAIRDFSWKLEGRSPLNEYRYYGGSIVVHAGNDFDGDMQAVRLALVPVGPLIDGSEGTMLALRQGDRYWVQYGYIEDVPIGRYRVTAVLEIGEGSRPLRIRNLHAKDGPQQELVLDFLPESDLSPGQNVAVIAIEH